MIGHFIYWKIINRHESDGVYNFNFVPSSPVAYSLPLKFWSNLRAEHLKDHLLPYEPAQVLRSTPEALLVLIWPVVSQPHTRDRALSVMAAKLWNAFLGEPCAFWKAVKMYHFHRYLSCRLIDAWLSCSCMDLYLLLLFSILCYFIVLLIFMSKKAR